MERKLVGIREAADFLGVTPSTLRRWEHEGKLVPDERTVGGYRRYDLARLHDERQGSLPTQGPVFHGSLVVEESVAVQPSKTVSNRPTVLHAPQQLRRPGPPTVGPQIIGPGTIHPPDRREHRDRSARSPVGDSQWKGL